MEGFEFGVGKRFLLAVEMTDPVFPNKCEESLLQNKISPGACPERSRWGRNDKWMGLSAAYEAIPPRLPAENYLLNQTRINNALPQAVAEQAKPVVTAL